MSEIFIDGLDKYANLTEFQLVWTVGAGTATFSTSSGRFGGGGVEGTNSCQLNIALPSTFTFDNSTLFYIGFSFKSNGATVTSPSQRGILQGGANSGTVQLINGGASGTHLQYITNIQTNASVDGTKNVTDGNWHWVEVAWLLHTSASGSMTAYVDGVLDASASNVVGRVSGQTGMNNFIFLPGFAFNNNDGFIDDIHIWSSAGTTMNNFPIGPARIYTIIPVANGDLDQYTPSTGSNYSCVNQGFSAATYVSDAATGNEDLYIFHSLSASPYVINTVAVNYYGQNSGSGTANLIPKCKTSGTTASAATKVLPVAVNNNLQGFFGKDGTNTTWTYTSVNGSQFGMGD